MPTTQEDANRSAVGAVIAYIGRNKTAVAFYALTLGVLVFSLFFASGCSARRWVNVPVPSAIQQAMQAPKAVPLVEAASLLSRWNLYAKGVVDEHNREGEMMVAQLTDATDLFVDEIDAGEYRAGIFQSLITMGFETATAAASAAPFPGAPLVIGALGLLGGLFTEKPGSKAREAREKEDSFNAGQKRAAEIASAVVSTVSPQLPQNEVLRAVTAALAKPDGGGAGQ